MEWYWYLIIILGLSLAYLIYAIKTAPLMPDNFDENLPEDKDVRNQAEFGR